MGARAPAGEVPPGTPAPPAGSAAYAFDSSGSGGGSGGVGTVRVIVLGYSQLEDSRPVLTAGDTADAPCPSEWSAPANQLQWLCAQLHFAKVPGCRRSWSAMPASPTPASPTTHRTL